MKVIECSGTEQALPASCDSHRAWPRQTFRPRGGKGAVSPASEVHITPDRTPPLSPLNHHHSQGNSRLSSTPASELHPGQQSEAEHKASPNVPLLLPSYSSTGRTLGLGKAPCTDNSPPCPPSPQPVSSLAPSCHPQRSGYLDGPSGMRNQVRRVTAETRRRPTWWTVAGTSATALPSNTILNHLVPRAAQEIGRAHV